MGRLTFVMLTTSPAAFAAALEAMVAAVAGVWTGCLRDVESTGDASVGGLGWEASGPKFSR
jgi:hypothetical protein